MFRKEVENIRQSVDQCWKVREGTGKGYGAVV